MHIFFGSQTGTAEGFARTLMEEGRQNGFDAQTVDLEDFEPETLADVTNAVFLMATYGEGEPTDNSAKFMGWLRQSGSIEPGFLAKTCFTVFGLGNTQYEHYNKMGRTTNQLLEQHGARRCCPYGEGDDDATLEEDFDKWRESMWPVMIAAFHPDGASVGDGSDALAGEGGMSESRKRARTNSKVELEFYTRVVMEEEVPELQMSREYDLGHSESLKFVSGKSVSSKSSSAKGKLNIHSSCKYYFVAHDCPVTVNRELRLPADGGVTRHIEVDISGSGEEISSSFMIHIIKFYKFPQGLLTRLPITWQFFQRTVALWWMRSAAVWDMIRTSGLFLNPLKAMLSLNTPSPPRAPYLRRSGDIVISNASHVMPPCATWCLT